MMKQLLIFCFWLVFLGNCGTGLAQSSSSNKPLLNQMYAYVQVGPEMQFSPDCFPNTIPWAFPLALTLGSGLHLNDHFDLGLSLNMTEVNNHRFFDNPSQKSFVGTSLHGTYRWKRLMGTAELGQAWRYRDGCRNGGWNGHEFQAEDPFIPYFRGTINIRVLDWFWLFASYGQSGFAEGTYYYYANNISGGGPSRYRTRSLQFGLTYLID